MDREWRTIADTDGMYLVSNFGEVFSMKSRKMLKAQDDKDGYKRLAIVMKDGSIKFRRVHNLVADAFIPNYGNKEQVNHKDLNRANNNVLNLEWVTAQENTDHKMLHIRGADDDRRAQLWLERVDK